jgi:hypothetical protein
MRGMLIPPQDLRRLAQEADVDARTLVAVAEGRPVRGRAGERARAVLARQPTKLLADALDALKHIEPLFIGRDRDFARRLAEFQLALEVESGKFGAAFRLVEEPR